MKIKDDIIVDFVLSNSSIPTPILKTLLQLPLVNVNVDVDFVKKNKNGEIEIPSAPIEITNKLKRYIEQSKEDNISMGTVIEKFDKELKKYKIDLPALPKMIRNLWDEK